MCLFQVYGQVLTALPLDGKAARELPGANVTSGTATLAWLSNG